MVDESEEFDTKACVRIETAGGIVAVSGASSEEINDSTVSLVGEERTPFIEDDVAVAARLPSVDSVDDVDPTTSSTVGYPDEGSITGVAAGYGSVACTKVVAGVEIFNCPICPGSVGAASIFVSVNAPGGS